LKFEKTDSQDAEKIDHIFSLNRREIQDGMGWLSVLKTIAALIRVTRQSPQLNKQWNAIHDLSTDCFSSPQIAHPSTVVSYK
jgi:hypothetical protein